MQFRFVVFVVVTGLCVVTAGSPDSRASDPELRQAAAQVSRIVAHRGASAERPECTLPAIRRAIEVGATAVEVDVRTSQDGELFILHDETLDRTTNGTGRADRHTLAQLQQFDAGVWFGQAYRGVRIPSLIEAAQECRGRIDLLLDLKEQGDLYDRRVADVIREHGDPAGTIVGVRSVAQAERFRRLLPESQQLAFIPSVDLIEDFAQAGAETIRLWPRWLQDGDQPAVRVRESGALLHLNGTLGSFEETSVLLSFRPDSLLSDHPGRLRSTLNRIAAGETPASRFGALAKPVGSTRLTFGESAVGVQTFLNRDYRMMELPESLDGLPRCVFSGGDGSGIRLRFREAAVVFAAFEYNNTGNWSFEDGRSADEFGWHLWKEDAYRGSSNPGKGDRAHRASIWFREFRPGQELTGLPRWWICLGVTDPETASSIPGFRAGLVSENKPMVRRFLHAEIAASPRPLTDSDFESVEVFREWQTRRRQRFTDRMNYPYNGSVSIVSGPQSVHQTHHRREFHVAIDGRRLFRFFRLEPQMTPETGKLPAIVCFMGHGKVRQILDDEDSYQHACASRFAESGALVYAMENIGMEPGNDTHLDLDQALRLEGHGWYSLLFAHQRMLLDHVFADPAVDVGRVGVAGVSTGGLLALSAAAMEPRIAAASVQGIFGSMRVSFIRDRHRHCRCGAIPGLLPEFDLPELALLVAPRPLHISNAQNDGFSPEEARRCVELITPLYQWSGGQLPHVDVPSGGHEFAFDPAFQFFQDSLDLNPGIRSAKESVE